MILTHIPTIIIRARIIGNKIKVYKVDNISTATGSESGHSLFLLNFA